MKNVLAFIAARMREPSTLAGLSVIGVLFGLPPGTVDTVGACIAGAAAIGAAVIPDSK